MLSVDRALDIKDIGVVTAKGEKFSSLKADFENEGFANEVSDDLAALVLRYPIEAITREWDTILVGIALQGVSDAEDIQLHILTFRSINGDGGALCFQIKMKFSALPDFLTCGNYRGCALVLGTKGDKAIPTKSENEHPSRTGIAECWSMLELRSRSIEVNILANACYTVDPKKVIFRSKRTVDACEKWLAKASAPISAIGRISELM